MSKRVSFILLIMALIVTACGGGSDDGENTSEAQSIQDTPIPQDTLVPSLTATIPPTATPRPTLPATFTAEADATQPTPTQIVITIEPLTGERVPPPIEIELPDNWLLGYDTILSPDIDNTVVPYRLAIYQNATDDTQSTIVLIWGFGNIVAFDPATGDSNVPNLFLDGVRLLSPLVIEAECNRGMGPERQFSVGGLESTGATFTAIDCPTPSPDVAGWFTGIQVDNLNFMFYALVEPATELNENTTEVLQSVLDSVEFRVDTLLETPEVTLTPAVESTESP